MMFRKIIAIACFAALPVHAEEGAFADGSEAKSWNLTAQEKARFTAKVVDVLCELTGDCPDNCGEGRRQLGLIREADEALVFPTKNGQPLFTGAAIDLQPYCGKMVEVDGLLTGGEEITAGTAKVYQIQRIREVDGEWSRANRWTKEWAKKFPEAKGKGPWFRRDPRIVEEIEKDGFLGLGLEKDKAFIKDWY